MNKPLSIASGFAFVGLLFSQPALALVNRSEAESPPTFSLSTSTTAAAAAAATGFIIAKKAKAKAADKKAGKADTGGGGPTNFDECVAVCDKQYPNGAAKDLKIVQCWETKCATSCGGEPDAGPDLPGTDGGKCTQTVDTGDAKCDTCTNSNCCAEWDGCFSDKECNDYETCFADCDQNFP